MSRFRAYWVSLTLVVYCACCALVDMPYILNCSCNTLLNQALLRRHLFRNALSPTVGALLARNFNLLNWSDTPLASSASIIPVLFERSKMILRGVGGTIRFSFFAYSKFTPTPLADHRTNPCKYYLLVIPRRICLN